MRQRNKPIKVLLAKPGLDGHDRGVKALALALRDQGMEVVYIGRRQTVEGIVQAALQEDVSVVGLSSLSGAHAYYFPKVVELLGQKGASDVMVIGGGIIPKEDAAELKQKGVAEIFGPGTLTKDIADYIKQNVER